MSSRSRRQFLATTIGSATCIGFVPNFPSTLLQASERAKHADNKILVVIQLSGGNDGLNTVVPFGDDAYYKNRFTLAIGRDSVHKIDDHCGFHPSMSGFSQLLEDGHLSIVQGVGYPNPNRSHFESMDLWHSAHRKNRIETGWLGEYLAMKKPSPDVSAVHIGEDEQPLALRSNDVQVPSIRTLEQFRLELANNDRLRQLIDRTVSSARPKDNDVLNFVQKSTLEAVATSERIEKVIDSDKVNNSYAPTSLGKKLQAVARLIGSDFESNIYYVTLDGFDTHSKQSETHSNLLQQLSDALSTFIADMKAQGNLNRVLTFSFSEFGRRLKENASLGTDHGAAAPIFLAGGSVVPGLHGKHPSLTDLQDGDLKFHTDYRRVYATILERWFQIDSQPILAERFQPLDVLS